MPLPDEGPVDFDGSEDIFSVIVTHHKRHPSGYREDEMRMGSLVTPRRCRCGGGQLGWRHAL